MDRTRRSSAHSRLLFLDNVRVFVIMFVILQHVALIYRVYGGDSDFTQTVLDLIIGITDVFMMPIMFFIAGYFALPSIRKKGITRFLHDKVMRIWVPWFIGVTLIVPIAMYCMYFMRKISDGAVPESYWRYWADFMRDAARFHTGFVTSPDQFSHKHLWFLSVLFFFFVLFAALYAIASRFPGIASKLSGKKQQTPTGMTRALIVLGFLSAAVFFTVKLFFRWGYQATLILGLIHFDPSRLAVFAVYFFFGVYAFSRKWFTGGPVLSGMAVWIPVFVLSLGAFIYTSISGSPAPTMGGKLYLTALRSVLGLSMFVVILSTAHRFRNSPHPFDRMLASNSYTVYIIHYPIHAAAALVLVPFTIPIPVKFAAVYLFSVVSSYTLGEFSVKHHHRLSIAGIILINILLFFFLK